MLGERKLVFVQGAAAASLLWTGVDGSLARAFESSVGLPDGAFGDFLALVVVLIWAALTAAVAWWGLTGRPVPHRLAARPARERRPRGARRGTTVRKRRSPASA